MRYLEFTSQYTDLELSTFTIYEGSEDWQISQSTAFKKGFKKHSSDQRVMSAFNELMSFIKSHNTTPAIRDYPPQFYVHQTRKDRRFDNSLWAHLKGQKIGLLFSVDNGIIQLIHLGTHQELGWN